MLSIHYLDQVRTVLDKITSQATKVPQIKEDIYVLGQTSLRETVPDEGPRRLQEWTKLPEKLTRQSASRKGENKHIMLFVDIFIQKK